MLVYIEKPNSYYSARGSGIADCFDVEEANSAPSHTGLPLYNF
jgi:hypothetical protein